jgi:polar amino acid transport system permease protein
VPYQWRFDVVWESLPFLFGGLPTTIKLAAMAMGISLFLGLLASLARLSARAWFRIPAQAYTDFWRGTPLLVQILWVYYSIPLIIDITPSAFQAALIALILNLGAFNAEIFRAGIQSIERGQREAALALGMTPVQALYRIILPQAVRRVIPPLGSMWVSLFKDTSIVSVIAVDELMYRGRVISTQTYRPLEIFTAVAFMYFCITYPQARLVDWLYERLRVRA